LLNSVCEMSEAIDFFKRFANKKPEIEENYRQLRNAFEHLENNHKLLTPLYRTMRRTKTEITGSGIKAYLEIFFAKRFERHRIVYHLRPIPLSIIMSSTPMSP
jgi:hypothetical protein